MRSGLVLAISRRSASVSDQIAGRFTGAYVAAKFAVEGWSDTLRLELAGSGISVSLIEPGPLVVAA